MDLRWRKPRWWLATSLAFVVIAIAAAPAFAHLAPEPSRVEPGASATVAFLVEHGCDEAPTIELTFQVPKGVKDVEPVDKDGWISDVDGRTVVFEGGPLDANTPDTFSISFTAPNKKKIIRWKVVQGCTEGLIRWIDTAVGAEHPPAEIGVGKDVPTDAGTESGHSP